MLLLIPLYFLLPEAWFENCLGSATFLSIAGLFVGLYQVEKMCIRDSSSIVTFALRSFSFSLRNALSASFKSFFNA